MNKMLLMLFAYRNAGPPVRRTVTKNVKNAPQRRTAKDAKLNFLLVFIVQLIVSFVVNSLKQLLIVRITANG